MSKTAPQAAGLRWHHEWRISLFVIVFVPLFVSLGFWQLQRADEKRAISAQWDLQRSLAPVDVGALDVETDTLAYRPVRVRGQALVERHFLLDNRIRDGRYGVEVITPVELADGQQVLVNRGWMAADPTRRELPEPPPMVGFTELSGYVYVPPGENYVIGEIASDERWPRLIQAVDVSAMGRMLQAPVFPQLVRLDEGSSGALRTDWPLINTRPEKHVAYAFQWFAMATALLLLFVWRGFNGGEKIGRR